MRRIMLPPRRVRIVEVTEVFRRNLAPVAA
jgi:hypothetical protein